MVFNQEGILVLHRVRPGIPYDRNSRLSPEPDSRSGLRDMSTSNDSAYSWDGPGWLKGSGSNEAPFPSGASRRSIYRISAPRS